jgi:hypothetical protein
MAFDACGLGVLPKQWESGLIVIKGSLFPRVSVVAFPTFRTLLSFVLVVFLMAGVTIRRGILVPIFRMTGFAGRVGMLPS